MLVCATILYTRAIMSIHKTPQPTMYLLLDNVRSAHNVGAMMRTADGLGIAEVLFCGYTPYPKMTHDDRLPHVAAQTHKKISKTALGAEASLPWRHMASIADAVADVRGRGAAVVGLEQSLSATPLHKYTSAPPKVALLVGNEVDGISRHGLALCDEIVSIPMMGRKESYNVAAATAMALYHLRFFSHSL